MTNNTRSITAQLALKIARALQNGPMRFTEISRAVGPTYDTALSLKLKRMVRDGLVARSVIRHSHPQIISYELTTLGGAFAKQAAALLGWVDENLDQIEAARAYAKSVAA